MQPSDSPVGIALSVPESWWEFDIRPEGREATIRALVNERIAETPELAPYRADVTTMLRKMAKDAHESGAVYMACMAENFDGVPLSATVTVSVLGAKGKGGYRPVHGSACHRRQSADHHGPPRGRRMAHGHHRRHR